MKLLMHKKYPLYKDIKTHLLLAFALSTWVFLFLFFAEPFDIHKFTQQEKITLLPIYGIIQGVCYCATLFYQQKEKKEKWTFKDEGMFIFLIVFIGFWFNFLFYKGFIVYNEEGTYQYYDYFKLIYLPALLIILPFVVIGRYILGRFYEINFLRDKITIKGSGKYEFITINSNELVYIQSSDNYVEVNFIENKLLEKKVIRGKISIIEKTFPFLVKTHRSYLINPIHFKQFKTQNKKLYAELVLQTFIPVSKSFQSSVKNKVTLHHK